MARNKEQQIAGRQLEDNYSKYDPDWFRKISLLNGGEDKNITHFIGTNDNESLKTNSCPDSSRRCDSGKVKYGSSSYDPDWFRTVGAVEMKKIERQCCDGDREKVNVDLDDMSWSCDIDRLQTCQTTNIDKRYCRDWFRQLDVESSSIIRDDNDYVRREDNDYVIREYDNDLGSWFDFRRRGDGQEDEEDQKDLVYIVERISSL